MALANRQPLPQFSPNDLGSQQLIQKLRVMARTIELYQGNNANSDDWLHGRGEPAAGLGVKDQFYLDDETGNVWLKTGEWSKVGTIAFPKDPDKGPVTADALLKILRAENIITLRKDDGKVYIGAPVVDGGGLPLGDRPTTVKIRRGGKNNLPEYAEDGELLLCRDTGEIFYGVNTDVLPLKVAPTNVIGLLDSDGTIADKYLPNLAGSVFVVQTFNDLLSEDPRSGDIGIVLNGKRGGRNPYAYDGYSWNSLDWEEKDRYLRTKTQDYTAAGDDDRSTLVFDTTGCAYLTLPNLGQGTYLEIVQRQDHPVFIVSGSAAMAIGTRCKNHYQSAGQFSRVHAHQIEPDLWQVYGDTEEIGYGAAYYTMNGDTEYGGFADACGC